MSYYLIPRTHSNINPDFSKQFFIQSKFGFTTYFYKEGKMTYTRTEFESPNRTPIFGDWEGKIKLEQKIDIKNKIEFVPLRTDNELYGEAIVKGIHFFIKAEGAEEIIELILVRSTDYRKACSERKLSPLNANYSREFKGYRFFEPYTGRMFPMPITNPVTSIKAAIEALKARFNGDSFQEGLSASNLKRLDEIIRDAKKRGKK